MSPAKEERRKMLEQVSQVVHEDTKPALDKEEQSRKSSAKGSEKSSQKLRYGNIKSISLGALSIKFDCKLH